MVPSLQILSNVYICISKGQMIQTYWRGNKGEHFYNFYSLNQSVDLEMSTTFDDLFRNTHLVYICHIFHFKKPLNLQGLNNTCSISLSQINQVSLVKNVWLDKNFEY